MSESVHIESITALGRGWGKLDNYRVTHGRRDGSTQTVDRTIYNHGLATALLLYSPEAGTVLLIRQFRLPPHLNGDPAWMIEAPAGMLDGEEPAVAARREAIEETGYDPQNLTFLFEAYASPGAVTEKTAYFLGRYDPGEKTGAGGGLAEEGEDIEILELPLAEALAMVADGRIMDAKTIILLQALALDPGRVG